MLCWSYLFIYERIWHHEYVWSVVSMWEKEGLKGVYCTVQKRAGCHNNKWWINLANRHVCTTKNVQRHVHLNVSTAASSNPKISWHSSLSQTQDPNKELYLQTSKLSKWLSKLNWLKLNYLFRKQLEWIHLAYTLVVLTMFLKVLKKWMFLANMKSNLSFCFNLYLL